MRTYFELLSWMILAHAELRLREKDEPELKLTSALRLAALAAELGERRRELARKIEQLDRLDQKMTEAQHRSFTDDAGFFIYRIGINFQVEDADELLDELISRARHALRDAGVLAN